jgi:hypothetical protein
MICLENDNNNNYDIFNQLLDKNNILTPELDYNDGIIDDYILYEGLRYNYKLIKNKIKFINRVYKNIKNIKKRKLEYNNSLKNKKFKSNNDICKIKCFCCKKDITEIYNKGELFKHSCFNCMKIN